MRGTVHDVQRFLLAVAIVLCALPAAAFDDPIAAYAAALRAFDPALDDAHAQRLAERTIVTATAYGIDARLVVALVAVESGWVPTAVSHAGARGLGQLMPGTAAGLGVDPDDPEANLDGTIRHLRALLDRYAAFPRQTQYERALAGYNAGAGAVERAHGVPPYPETRAYVRRVIVLWRRLAGM